MRKVGNLNQVLLHATQHLKSQIGLGMIHGFPALDKAREIQHAPNFHATIKTASHWHYNSGEREHVRLKCMLLRDDKIELDCTHGRGEQQMLLCTSMKRSCMRTGEGQL